MILKEILSEYVGKKVYFVRPGGNHGDYLIYKGAEKIAKQVDVKNINLSYLDFIGRDFSDGSIFYIHGSGGYNSWCSGTPFKILEKCISVRGSVVIQGASSVENNISFIKDRLESIFNKNASKKIIFISRELESFELLKSFFSKNIELILDQDTALYLDRSDIVNEYGQIKPLYDLRVVRRDNESSFSAIEKYYYKSMINDPAISCKSFDDWVKAHMLSKTIVSNRTHSAILGAILELPTTISPGSYHKNRSIWEYSLSDRGVKWLSNSDYFDLLEKEKHELMNSIPLLFQKSWKVRFLWNKYYLKYPY